MTIETLVTVYEWESSSPVSRPWTNLLRERIRVKISLSQLQKIFVNKCKRNGTFFFSNQSLILLMSHAEKKKSRTNIEGWNSLITTIYECIGRVRLEGMRNRKWMMSCDETLSLNSAPSSSSSSSLSLFSSVTREKREDVKREKERGWVRKKYKSLSLSLGKRKVIKV